MWRVSAEMPPIVRAEPSIRMLSMKPTSPPRQSPRPVPRAARLAGQGLWKGGDVGVIDGILIDGSARTIGGVAALSRRLQSGYLYWYALVMIVGVIGLMTWQLWPFLGNMIGR